MYGESFDFQCQHLQQFHGRVLIANLLQKLIFPFGHFMLPLLMLTSEALRVQTVFHKLFQVYHVYRKFKLGYMCLDYRNFWYTERLESFKGTDVFS